MLSRAYTTDLYMLLEQFLVGLPSWMASKMIEDFGLSPESNSLDDFVATAKAIEQRGKTKMYYEAMKRNVQGNTSTLNNRALPKASPAPCQTNVSYNAHRASLPRTARFARPPPKYNNANKAKPFGRNDPPHNDHHKVGQASKEAHPPQRQKTAKDTCFNCGKKGHFSPNCPNPSKPKRDFIQAARSTTNGEDNEDPNNKNYQVSEADNEHKDDEESMTPQSVGICDANVTQARHAWHQFDACGDSQGRGVTTSSLLY